MKLLEGHSIPNGLEEKVVKVSQVFLFYYEILTNKNANHVRYDDQSEYLCNGDKFLFGKLVLQIFSVFGIKANHLPFKEFELFPTVADLVLYVAENSKD